MQHDGERGIDDGAVKAFFAGEQGGGSLSAGSDIIGKDQRAVDALKIEGNGGNLYVNRGAVQF